MSGVYDGGLYAVRPAATIDSKVVGPKVGSFFTRSTAETYLVQKFTLTP